MPKLHWLWLNAWRTKHYNDTTIESLNTPGGRLWFSKVNSNPANISTVSSSDEILDFNVLTPLNPATTQTNVSTNTNENQSQVSKVTLQSNCKTVSTLLQGMSLISFDTYAIRWNVREVVKDVLFHQKPYINDHTELEFSENDHSICAIVLKELNMLNKNDRAECWRQIKIHIPNFLNKKRTTIVQMMKKKFKGKFMSTSIVI